MCHGTLPLKYDFVAFTITVESDISSFLINTARGGLVDEEALYTVLVENKLAGAALDVFASEPPVGGPLLELKNVVVTPHIGAHTKGAIERVGVLAAQNVVQALQTGEPIYRVV